MEDKNVNWIDPDILAFDESLAFSGNREKELAFKRFFEIGWLDPKYDDIRESWDSLLKDEDPHGRLLAKTALWSVIRLRQFDEDL
jgi:hypothetical protein